MDDLVAARLQMALTLGFHIIFASIGVAMPFLMATAHWKYLRTNDETYLLLTKAWSKGVAIFFAVGAVSGTILSFELGLLWPEFMRHAGPIIGMPFSWEGTAFFLEAIALGVFLYGWNKISPWAHWASGIVVGCSGAASAMFVICANSWMNNPSGFDWNDGNPINIDPWAAMFNDGWFLQGAHMVVAAFQAVGFAVAGVHALLFLRTRHEIHSKAVTIAFTIAAVAAIAQPVVGDLLAKTTAQRQPLKLAAMEGHFETSRYAPLILGGIPNVETRQTTHAIRIPGMLSFLAYNSFDAEVKGLNDFPRENWPPVLVTHLAFQVMVGIGTGLAALGVAGLIFLRRAKSPFARRTPLLVLIGCTPLGFIAIEAGWIVTEVGRQPWIIYNLLRTRDALTPRPGIFYSLLIYTAVYLFLSFVVWLLMSRQVRALHRQLGVNR